MPVLGLLPSLGWGRNNYTFGDCPPQGGLGMGNGGHSHNDPVQGLLRYSGQKVMGKCL